MHLKNALLYILYIIYLEFFFLVFHNYVSKNAFARRAIFSFFVTSTSNNKILNKDFISNFVVDYKKTIASEYKRKFMKYIPSIFDSVGC